MGALKIEQENNSTKNKFQDEIYLLFKEVKELEKKFENFSINKIELNEELDLVEFEELEKFQSIETIEDIEKPSNEDTAQKLKHISEINKEKIEKQINPATFRFRYNNEGKFVNIDIKKRKLKTKSKKSFILKRIKIRKKTKSDTIEEKSKLLIFKTVVAKLKKVIPNKSKEPAKVEQIVKEEKTFI